MRSDKLSVPKLNLSVRCPMALILADRMRLI
jgi:hypothetical protein